MKTSWKAAALFLMLPGVVPAASKEMIELQRDVAQLQNDLRLLQQSLDTKLAQMQVLLQQTLDASNKSNSAVADLARTTQSSGSDIGRQVAQPIAVIGTKVDGMGQDLQSLQTSVADQNARMSKIELKLVDLSNAIRTMQAPAPPPPGGASPTSVSPGSSPQSSSAYPGAEGTARPPIGANDLWLNAKRDMDGGKDELALSQYQDYLKYYRSTDVAPNAQYNIGQIHYNQHKLDEAVQDFDQVLEAWPVNSKTPDAHYMKGRALIQLGRRNEAAKEFQAVVSQFPSSPIAANARVSLKALGLAPPTPAAPARRRR